MASVLLSACGLLVGIEPLSVGDDDGGVVLQDAEASADAEGSTGDASMEAGPEPLRRPPEGTYVYAVTGSDKISGAFSFGTTYGPTATLTVGYVGADCFKQTFVLRDGYEETMNSCIEGVDSVEHTGARSQRFALGISAQTTSTCMPGDVYFTSAPSPGRSWNHDCSGKNTDDKSGQSTFSTVGSYRFIGNETISISGSAVPVMHFHDERNVSGAQTGTNVADWYLTVEDGVLVRLSRNINLDYGSVIGNINYRETVLMTLQTPPGLLLDAGAD